MATAALTVQLSQVERDVLKRSRKPRAQRVVVGCGSGLGVPRAQEWQVSAIEAGIASLDREGGIAHAAVRNWIDSWDTDDELDPPKPSRA